MVAVLVNSVLLKFARVPLFPTPLNSVIVTEPSGFGVGNVEGTPLADNGFLYVSDPWGTPYKFDVSDGKTAKLLGMGDNGQKRTRRPARHPLALLPVSDGLDRHAKPGRKFELCQLGTAAKIAHRRRGRRFDRRDRCDESRHRHFGHERKFRPIPQFDDPSVRFQPQALHVRSNSRARSGITHANCRRCALRSD